MSEPITSFGDFMSREYILLFYILCFIYHNVEIKTIKHRIYIILYSRIPLRRYF